MSEAHHGQTVWRPSRECGKVKYDLAGARRALANLRKRRKSLRKERGIYWCRRCEAYHLTSMSKTDRRKAAQRAGRQ